MNRTISSNRSMLSGSQTSKKSFRVLVKNRTTHQILDSQLQKNKSQNQLMKSTIENESFESIKNNLKKYIRNMKAPSKLTSYENKMNTNRSSRELSQGLSKVTSRSNINSVKNLNQTLRTSFVQNNQRNKIHVQQMQSLQSKDISSNHPKSSLRYHTESHEQHVSTTKLPTLKTNYRQYLQQQSFSEDLNSKQVESSSRQRICDLQNKIEQLLVEKLKMHSSTNSFSSNNEIKNKTVYKLLEKEIERVLEQIRKIKETEQNLFDTIQHHTGQKDNQINKNIEMLEKKVKIIERLIAEKLFQSDNLKNQYLKKIKQHRRFISEASFNKRSKSSNLYKDANKLNPSNFKPLHYERQPVSGKDITTNRASYKMPLKSYYISPQKDYFYNPDKLTQPLPRSTYNCEYLIYGALPKDLITRASGQPDHNVIANTLSQDKQKSILQGSTYKEDFSTKIEKEPINFRQLDCYKDKFKNLQVNYGMDKNDYKVVNSQSVIEFYEKDKKLAQKKQLKNQLNKIRIAQNPQKISSSSTCSKLKDSKVRIKIEELNRSIGQLKQTQKMGSMIEQQQMNKNNLFNQRIKSEIKHKNVYDQKYKFKNELIKEKIRKMDDYSKRQKLVTSLTLQH